VPSTQAPGECPGRDEIPPSIIRSGHAMLNTRSPDITREPPQRSSLEPLAHGILLGMRWPARISPVLVRTAGTGQREKYEMPGTRTHWNNSQDRKMSNLCGCAVADAPPQPARSSARPPCRRCVPHSRRIIILVVLVRSCLATEVRGCCLFMVCVGGTSGRRRDLLERLYGIGVCNREDA
jgi:hypothetical protein